MQQWKATAIVTTFAVYLLYSMEWLFFVTKPSFMSAMPASKKTLILLAAPLPQAMAGVVVVALLFALSRAPGIRRADRAVLAVSRFVPACAFGSLALLMMDNFTNTLFGLQIQGSRGAGALIYAFITLVLYSAAYLLTRRGIDRIAARASRVWGLAAIALPALSGIALVVASFGSGPSMALPAFNRNASRQPPPNVLLIGGDGIEAEHISWFGYERETTPFLDSQMHKALVCENAFSNSAHTRSSLASMLTGRLPTETRVIFPPDILSGPEVFRHLPGMLKSIGYTTMHVSMRHFGDPYDWNLRVGFDRSTFRNGRLFQAPPWIAATIGTEIAYFIERVSDRVRVRALWLWRDNMPPAVEEIKVPGRRRTPDAMRLTELIDFVAHAPQPFFAHAHFMGSHGPKFRVRTNRHSIGQVQDDEWMVDFYDDAIRDFDEYVATIFEALDGHGVLANTLLVIYSDHGRIWNNRHRVPLFFFFPEGEHSGRVSSNTQNIDILTTILDYIGVDQPDWTSGISLLAGDPDPSRPIFGAACDRAAFGLDDGTPDGVQPPFYSMGVTTLIVCDRSYVARWGKGTMTVSTIKGHTEPCHDEVLVDGETAERMILNHLAERGYDISSVEKLKIREVRRRPKASSRRSVFSHLE